MNRPGSDGGLGLRNLPHRGGAGLTVVLFELDHPIRAALRPRQVDKGRGEGPARSGVRTFTLLEVIPCRGLLLVV